MNKKILVLLIVILIIVVLGMGYGVYKASQEKDLEFESGERLNNSGNGLITSGEVVANGSDVNNLKYSNSGDFISPKDVVIFRYNGMTNPDKLEEFIKATNYQNKDRIEEFVRIVQYTIEGDPIIDDVRFYINENGEGFYEITSDYTNDAFGTYTKVFTKKYSASAYDIGKVETDEYVEYKLYSNPLANIDPVPEDVFLAGYTKVNKAFEFNKIFFAKVLEVNENGLLIEPNEDELERKSCDKISVSYGEYQQKKDFKVDEEVLITYNGLIQETYTAKISANVASVEDLKESIVYKAVGRVLDEETNKTYEEYEKVSEKNYYDETGKKVVNLVKFNDTLYTLNEYVFIDWIRNPEGPVGTIDKLIPSEYVPLQNGETNCEKYYNAVIDSATEESMIVILNGGGELFSKVTEK